MPNVLPKKASPPVIPSVPPVIAFNPLPTNFPTCIAPLTKEPTPGIAPAAEATASYPASNPAVRPPLSPEYSCFCGKNELNILAACPAIFMVFPILALLNIPLVWLPKSIGALGG